MSKFGGVPEKVAKYETFLNEVLRGELKRLVEQRTAIAEEIADYNRLRATTLALRHAVEPYKTRVDVGCGFLMQAELSTKGTLLVAVGYGFFAELTFDEADKYAEKKIGLLKEKDAEVANRANEVKADIRIVLEGLRELQNLPVPAQPTRRVEF
jgi:prefoldin alpha subunit